MKKLLKNPIAIVSGFLLASHAAYLTDLGKNFWNWVYSTLWIIVNSLFSVKIPFYGWVILLEAFLLGTAIFLSKKYRDKNEERLTELQIENRRLKDEIESSKIDVVEGKRDVDGMRWKYRANRATGEWISLAAFCPICGMQLCVEDVSADLAITKSQYRVHYFCDNQDCGKFSKVFQGTDDDREDKAIRHINLNKKIS